MLANQCRYVTGLRVRRAQQIAQLYSRLYSESSRCALLGRFWRRLRGRPGHASALMAALSGVFVWEEERIQEEELKRSIKGRKRRGRKGGQEEGRRKEERQEEARGRRRGKMEEEKEEEQGRREGGVGDVVKEK